MFTSHSLKASHYTVSPRPLTMTISVPFFCAQRSTSLAMLWALEGVLWRLTWAGREATVACFSQRLQASAQEEFRLDTASSQVAWKSDYKEGMHYSIRRTVSLIMQLQRVVWRSGLELSVGHNPDLMDRNCYVVNPHTYMYVEVWLPHIYVYYRPFTKMMDSGSNSSTATCHEIRHCCSLH